MIKFGACKYALKNSLRISLWKIEKTRACTVLKLEMLDAKLEF